MKGSSIKKDTIHPHTLAYSPCQGNKLNVLDTLTSHLAATQTPQPWINIKQLVNLLHPMYVTDILLQRFCAMYLLQTTSHRGSTPCFWLQGLYPMYLLLTTSYRGSTPRICYWRPVTEVLCHVHITNNQLQGLYPMYLLLTTSYRGCAPCLLLKKKLQGLYPMCLLLTKIYRGSAPCICYWQKVTWVLHHISVTDIQLQGLCLMYLLLMSYRGSTPCICYQLLVTEALSHVPVTNYRLHMLSNVC